jgi:hypothetical protein
MDESQALEVVAVRAVEVADTARGLWSDDERAWASRAAAEVVGADASATTFLARRAALVVERLGARQPLLPRTVRALRWRPWIGTSLAGIGFVLGVFLDQVDRAQRINILAPPVLGLLAWNLAVYAFIAVGYVLHYGDGGAPGPMRRMLTAVAGGRSPSSRRLARGAMQQTLVALVTDWGVRSAPLQSARAVRMLHVAAAALAAGVIAGLYVRGLALEYRATWQSTFLDAPAVHFILAAAYAPGALLLRVTVPDAAAIAAIRAPASTNAAQWIHLMAATVAAIVILPRLLLALGARLVERHRAANMVLPLEEPYFRRLLRGFHGGTARVRVIPYSHAPDAAAVAGLESIVGRVFGGGATMTVTAPVAYGDEVESPSGADTALVALFNAAATPEREVHGAFLEALAAHGNSPVALVDETEWVAHWTGDGARINARRAAWQRLGADAGVHVVFAELAAPDVAAAVAGFESAMSHDG